MTSYTSDILAIDTTSPEMTVSYTKANTEAGKKMYYNQDVIVTFTVNEKNFSDVFVCNIGALSF